jgi:predicted RNA binding protein YcfA (HicA-like mRNA interferase family)
LKSVSGKRLCRVLESHGWRLARVRGSHHIYTHPESNNILTVPVHGNTDLKVGTLSALLKAAGLTESNL